MLKQQGTWERKASSSPYFNKLSVLFYSCFIVLANTTGKIVLYKQLDVQNDSNKIITCIHH